MSGLGVGRAAVLATRLAAGIADLSPAYFALVMATGIVSIAAHRAGMALIAVALFRLNLVVYLALWLLNGLRIALHARRFFRDLGDHRRSPGLFTAVAATCILGSQFVLIAGDLRPACLLWGVGIALWVVLTYAVFTSLTIATAKPPLAEVLTGAWLLAVVATQSVAVLGALVAAGSPQPFRLGANFVALSLWLASGMLYVWMIGLIFYRCMFLPFSPADLVPSYWITMGAMAISTLAGALLVTHAPDAPFLYSLLPFLEGFTLFYWATGTWWIPMLVILSMWKYVRRRFSLQYDSSYWSAVFPLGMYSVGTSQTAAAMELGFLEPVARFFLYAALLAWGLVFAGMVRALAARVTGSSGAPGPPNNAA